MAATLDQFVSRVRSLSESEKYAELVETIEKSTEMLARNISHATNVLESLDPERHSLGHLAVLSVKTSMPSVPDIESCIHQIAAFIKSCAPEQIRYAAESYCLLCHFYAKSLVDLKKPLRGIDTIRLATEKLQPSMSCLTSIHADLAQLCLLSKCLKPAIPFLDSDVSDFVQEGGRFDVKPFLLYYYYGGMIYTGLKQFERALHFFEVAVTTPAQALSAIMLEAYKKYIVVSLLLHGKVGLLPKYTSGVVARYLKPMCGAYNDLSAAYSSNSSAELQRVVAKHTDIFTRDTNMGLVKQVVASMNRKNILRLTKTFLTLSLTDVANRVHLSGSKEAEEYVLRMIEDGEIFATIDQAAGMVSFHDSPESYSDDRMRVHIDSEIQKSMKLTRQIQQMDQDIAVNPQFVRKTLGLQADEDVSLSFVVSRSLRTGEPYVM
ncbi:COP9 signalosome complex subunit 3-like [Corticium candelabrum]|uniref:COP9 signalosome complex subunit 3-like n=1 Tax=Corticium candelabrum TaxID=121492 RepID=UPI002E34B315|nr:COP9 signalosome complex subunit 3-like [Corticium candelabrum]